MKEDTSKKLWRILSTLLETIIYEEDGSAEHISEHICSREAASLIKELAADNKEIANALAKVDLTKYPYSEVSDILS